MQALFLCHRLRQVQGFQINVLGVGLIVRTHFINGLEVCLDLLNDNGNGQNVPENALNNTGNTKSVPESAPDAPAKRYRATFWCEGTLEEIKALGAYMSSAVCSRWAGVHTSRYHHP